MPTTVKTIQFKSTKNILFSAIAALLPAAAAFLRSGSALLPTLGAWLLCAFLCLCVLSFRDAAAKTAGGILGTFFALCCALSAFAVSVEDSVDNGGLLIFFVGCFVFFAALLSLLFHFLKGFSLMSPPSKVRDCGKRRLFLLFAGAFLLLFFWFCLWLLYRFPGCLSPDSTWQMLQARGNLPLSNHHPIAHTMIIRLTTQLGYILSRGNPSLALAAYSLVQCAMLSLCYAWLTVSLYSMGVKLWAVIAVFASLFLLPYHGEISVTMAKDVWFAAAVLCLSLCLWRIKLSLARVGKIAFVDYVLLFVSSVAMCLFRSNGYYAFILSLPFLLAFYYKKSRVAPVLLLVALAFASLVKGPVYDSFGVVQPDAIESLSAPAQHIARVIADGHMLTEEQYDLLSHAVDVEQVANTYVSYLSDPIKDLVRFTGDQEYIGSHRSEFLRLWLALGIEHPFSYLRAQLDLTRGYWFPRTDGIVMYDFYTHTQDDGLVCLLPSVLEGFFSLLARSMPSMPLIKYFFSNGAAVWLCLFLFALCFVKKERDTLVLFIPVLAVWATLIVATPLDNEFRYVYSLYASLSLLCIAPFSHVNCYKDKVASL